LRFYFFGPSILGIRPGISFGLNDLRARARPRLARPGGYIYVIRGDNRVKVGITRSPENRLAQIQAQCTSRIDYAFLAPTSGDPCAIEKEAHAMLANYRLGG
jgi:hypothetical protein